MPGSNDGAQRASSDQPVQARPITRSYPFVSWHAGLDPQPARKLGAVGRPILSTRTARKLVQARPLAPARTLLPAQRPDQAQPMTQRPRIVEARSLTPASRSLTLPAPSRITARAVLVPLLAMIVSLAGFAATTAPVAATSSRLKAVIIVGPTGSVTSYYHDIGEAIAQSAERHGMDVRRVYAPHATWSNVLANIQGANLVVSLGHGNGWPSQYAPFQTDTKDGLGLNASDGGSNYTTKYYGEGPVASSIKLAPNAVVLLSHMCFTAGSSSTDSGAISEWTARQRVDNYGAGFIRAGARAVFAYGWSQKADFVAQLMTSHLTMDQIFMARGNGEYDGYSGGRDIRFASSRSHGYSAHLDPNSNGYLRSVIGNLSLTTDQWKSGAPPADHTKPVLGGLSMTASTPATSGQPARAWFSPNGDGIADRLPLYHTLSEDAWLDATVERDDGSSAARFKLYGHQGRSLTTWDGRGDKGKLVRDGNYTLVVVPRDASGNRGAAARLSLRVMTAIKAPKVSSDALYSSDGDSLNAGTTLSATLTKTATLIFSIRSLSGSALMRHSVDRELSPGNYHWTWNGKDDHGRYVPTGYYRATMIAKNAVGTQTTSITIFVGSFKVFASDWSPARGSRVSFTVYSTEPLQRAPSVTVGVPGGGSANASVSSTSTPGRYIASLTVPSSGHAGTGWLRMTGVDRGGKTQSRTIAFEID